jgi:hypothetical protein
MSVKKPKKIMVELRPDQRVISNDWVRNHVDFCNFVFLRDYAAKKLRDYATIYYSQDKDEIASVLKTIARQFEQDFKNRSEQERIKNNANNQSN